jgi:hypothetical protein
MEDVEEKLVVYQIYDSKKRKPSVNATLGSPSPCTIQGWTIMAEGFGPQNRQRLLATFGVQDSGLTSTQDLPKASAPQIPPPKMVSTAKSPQQQQAEASITSKQAAGSQAGNSQAGRRQQAGSMQQAAGQIPVSITCHSTNSVLRF